MPDEQSSGRIEILNGVQIYFEIRGGGEPLVLLHGFSGSSQDWKTLAPQSLAGFRLIMPDLRGHGRSSILSKPFRHQDAATDMLALLDHLGITAYNSLRIRGGGNVLLHMATKQRHA